MAVGAGYYFGAAATTVVVVLALYLLREFRARIISRFQTNFSLLEVAFSGTGDEISEVVNLLERHRVEIRGLDAELEEDQARYTIQLRIPPRHNVHDALKEITALPHVKRVGISGLHEVD